MTEFKRQLLLKELAKIGYTEAFYIPESYNIKIKPDNDRMPFIRDDGLIFYGSEYDNLVEETIKPLVNKVMDMIDEPEKPYIKVFIQPPEERGRRGEWLSLPAGTGDLSGLLGRLGVSGGQEPAFHISMHDVAMEGVRNSLNLSDKLDELNMLAHYLDDLEPFEIENLQAILFTGHFEEGCGAAALINLLTCDNFHAYDLIDAGGAEELGRYWAREMSEDMPEGMTPEEYGRECVKEENGIFTPWGYVYQREQLSPLYDGIVPDEYRITVPPQKPEVYIRPADYARQNGELGLYRESGRLNRECARAIEGAISRHWSGSRLAPAAVKSVIDAYGAKRVNIILAATVCRMNYDTRFSPGNRDWAKNLPPLPDTQGCLVNSHPVKLNEFISQARDEAVLSAAAPESVGGYTVKQSTLFENDRGFALAQNPNAGAPFVTWQFTEDNGAREYYWGHYHKNEAAAVCDYKNRVSGYKMDYPGLKEKRTSVIGRLEAAKKAVKPPAPGGRGKKQDLEVE